MIMISLESARNLVEEVIGEEIPSVYTELTFREWAREGAISRMKVKNGKSFYPDIVTTEILTALRLKKNYSLSEIAEARECLELEGGQLNQITEEDLIRFINCKKLFKDKKLATKLTLKKIDSLAKIKGLIDDLLREKKHLEVVEDYLKEFLKADKELSRYKEKKEVNYVS